MSALELRQMIIRNGLETIIAQAYCLLEILNIDGENAAEAMQTGADLIRSLSNELMERV